ncbi:MAG: ATP-binding protein [Armatimonadota bacterium]
MSELSPLSRLASEYEAHKQRVIDAGGTVNETPPPLTPEQIDLGFARRHNPADCPPEWEGWKPTMAQALFPAELYKLVEEGHGFTEDPAAETWLQGYMAKIGQVIESGRHLVMIGAPGCGKSFACARLARAAWREIGADLAVCYAFGPRLLDALKGEHYGDNSPLLYFARRAKLLIVDDIDRNLAAAGSDKQLPMALGLWDDMAATRHQNLRATVVTANRTFDELQNVVEWERWLDRVEGRGDILSIRGGSQRRKRQVQNDE